MTIHHATAARAAKLGVVLTEAEHVAIAHHTERNLAVEVCSGEGTEHETATDAAKEALVNVTDMLDWMDDPAHADIRLSFEEGDFVASSRKGDKAEIARDPVLADLFETLTEQEPDVEDEEEERGSVVPAVFKKRYAEQGHPTHCGDWLAETLNSLCRVKGDKGKETTDLDRLEAIATANGVDAARVDRLGTATNGWQGRYRMTTRNMLTKVVAGKGFLFVPEGCGRDEDTEIAAPREWVVAHSPKPKEPAAAKETPKASPKPAPKKKPAKAK